MQVRLRLRVLAQMPRVAQAWGAGRHSMTLLSDAWPPPLGGARASREAQTRCTFLFIRQFSTKDAHGELSYRQFCEDQSGAGRQGRRQSTNRHSRRSRHRKKRGQYSFQPTGGCAQPGRYCREQELEAGSILGRQGLDAITEMAGQARDAASNASDSIVAYTKQNPVKALAIAAASGALLYAAIKTLSASRD